MAVVSKEEEKTFEYYLDLSWEIRGMVIDSMDYMDRCRFTQCSKLCGKEVKGSKNYIYGLVLVVDIESCTYIHVSFGNEDTNGFFLIFYGRNGDVWIECQNYKEEFLWEQKLDYPMSSTECVLQHFKHLLHIYQNRFKFLVVSTQLENYDYGIRSLNNLRGIEIDGDFNFDQIFSKIRRPLRFLSVTNCETLQNCQEIYEVRKTLDLPNFKFTSEQFQRISTRSANIHIGFLTDMDIYDFIQSWRQRTLGRIVKKYTWRIPRASEFDKERLFRRLLGRAEGDEIDVWRIDVKVLPRRNTGRYAIVRYLRGDDSNYPHERDWDEEGDEDEEEVNENEEDGEEEQNANEVGEVFHNEYGGNRANEEDPDGYDRLVFVVKKNRV